MDSKIPFAGNVNLVTVTTLPGKADGAVFVVVDTVSPVAGVTKTNGVVVDDGEIVMMTEVAVGLCSDDIVVGERWWHYHSNLALVPMPIAAVMTEVACKLFLLHRRCRNDDVATKIMKNYITAAVGYVGCVVAVVVEQAWWRRQVML